MFKFKSVFILSGNKNTLKYVNNKQNVIYQKCKQIHKSSSSSFYLINNKHLFNYSTVTNQQCGIIDNNSYNVKQKNGFINQHILSGRNPQLLNNQTNHLQLNHQRFFSNDSSKIEIEIPAPQFEGLVKFLVDSPPILFCQESLVWLHQSTGLPWWAVIVLVTCSLRTFVTLPLALYQQTIMAKVANVKEEMNDIIDRLKLEANVAVSHFDMRESDVRQHYNRSVKEHWNQLIIRDNCHPMKALLIFVFQIPMWVVLSAGLRNLCYMLPKPTQTGWETLQQLSVEGFGWVTDLSVADPYWILPISFGIINLINIEIQTMLRVTDTTKLQNVSMNMFRVIALLMIPLTGFVPSSMCLYWTTSAAYGTFQSLIVVSPRVRRLVGIPESHYDMERPYKHLFNNLKKRLRISDDKKIV